VLFSFSFSADRQYIMIYKKLSRHPESQFICQYQLMQPIVLKIQKVDGTIESFSFGIGEMFSVWEPSIQLLVCTHEKLEKIPLSDGSFIIDPPEELEKCILRVWDKE